MTAEPLIPLAEAAWCGHRGEYRVTAYLCGRPRSASDQVVECLTCGRQYLNSELSAIRRADQAPADADRCEKTELLRRDCAHCRPKQPRQPRRQAEASPPPRPRRPSFFEARYGGHCTRCDDEIIPGDSITRNTEGYGYLCQTCALDEES